MKSFLRCLPLLYVLCAGQQGMAAEASLSAGIVDSIRGDVVLVNAGDTLAVTEKMHFRAGDTIKTGRDSSVGLIFKDDTVVSLGPNSEIAVEEFLFNPRAQELSFVTRMLHGTFSFVTGQIGKLAPKKVRIETPNATLGVRGTRFLVKVD